jgi:adenylate kinase
MILVLLGPPGAGKGTQAARLAAASGMRHLSSGDLLRSERKKGTQLGRRVSGYMDAGHLVPDDIIVEAILGELQSSKPEAGVILDGFPRTVSQARSLDEALAKIGQRVERVANIQVPDREIVNRITGRRICPTCGSVYHVEKHPPAQPGKCDRDGTPLVHRPDDTEEVVQQRLAAYHAQTEPLEAYYRGKGLLVEVDGTPDADSVFPELERIVKRRPNEAVS